MAEPEPEPSPAEAADGSGEIVDLTTEEGAARDGGTTGHNGLSPSPSLHSLSFDCTVLPHRPPNKSAQLSSILIMVWWDLSPGDTSESGKAVHIGNIETPKSDFFFS